jgi:hypothetical protein
MWLVILGVGRFITCANGMKVEIPNEIKNDLGTLVHSLSTLGFQPYSLMGPESFGNFSIAFTNNVMTFSIVRDRGQFHVDDVSTEQLQTVGLWESFSGVRELESRLLQWLKISKT